MLHKGQVPDNSQVRSPVANMYRRSKSTLKKWKILRGNYCIDIQIEKFYNAKTCNEGNFRCQVKATVAWDGAFAHSNHSGPVIKDLKYFWSGSSNYRNTAKIMSLSVVGEYSHFHHACSASTFEYNPTRKLCVLDEYTKIYLAYSPSTN